VDAKGGAVVADRHDDGIQFGLQHMGRTLLISLALFGTMMVGFAMSRTFYLSASIPFTAGLLLVMCFSLTTSLAQLLAPPELRGRVATASKKSSREGTEARRPASRFAATLGLLVRRR
jgi:hypothetical protein